MRANLLIMRWVLLNGAIMVLLVIAWRHGLVQLAWQSDTTWITTAILALFGWSFAGVTYRIFQASIALDSLRGEGTWKVREFRLAGPGPDSSEALKTKLQHRHDGFEDIGGTVFVMLGFLGTLYGMYLALPDLDGRSITDISTATLVLASLGSGFKIALWTSITGLIANLVLSYNLRLLRTGYTHLYTALLEDRDVRAS